MTLVHRLATSGLALLVALWGCGSPTVSPSGIALDQPLPELIFQGPGGEAVSLSAYAEPNKFHPHVLAVRMVTGWCGPCLWQAANTRSLIPPDLESRIRILDVVLAGEDNGPPESKDLARWQSRVDGVAQVVSDPDFQWSPLFPKRAALPLIALVDTRTMTPLAALSAPTPEALSDAFRSAVARVDGAAAPAPQVPTLVDGRFARDAAEMIRAMALGGTAPSDPSNAHEDEPAAIAFGKALFFDPDLSPSPKKVSCGSCHVPELLFQDGKDQAPEGVGMGSRNVPTVILAADQRWQFWDGRADSAWAQAIMPIEDPNEMASSRLFVAHTIQTKYRSTYEASFGRLPDLSDPQRFPPAGRPGDAAWDSLSAADRTEVNRIFANIGKSMAAYERSLRPSPNALDRYAAGDMEAFTAQEKDGLAAFFSSGCAQCHYGPRLTDDAFHSLRFPTGRPDRSADPGRIEGIPKLLVNDFLRSGPFSDAPSGPIDPPTRPALLGAFKTPGLRGVAFTLPYGHGGSFGGLTSTLKAHQEGGLPPESPYAVGTSEPWLVEFDPAAIPKIEAFLNALRLDLPP